MGRSSITANYGTSLVSWQCGWEVSEHFGVCYKLSLIQDGVCWKRGFIWSFNMKTWWLTLINHLLDFMDWALSSPRGIISEETCFCCLAKAKIQQGFMYTTIKQVSKWKSEQISYLHPNIFLVVFAQASLWSSPFPLHPSSLSPFLFCLSLSFP